MSLEFTLGLQIAEVHLDAIPVEHIEDITHLRSRHIPMMVRLYNTSLAILQQKNLAVFKPGTPRKLQDYLISGYAHPRCCHL